MLPAAVFHGVTVVSLPCTVDMLFSYGPAFQPFSWIFIPFILVFRPFF